MSALAQSWMVGTDAEYLRATLTMPKVVQETLLYSTTNAKNRATTITFVPSELLPLLSEDARVQFFNKNCVYTSEMVEGGVVVWSKNTKGTSTS